MKPFQFFSKSLRVVLYSSLFSGCVFAANPQQEKNFSDLSPNHFIDEDDRIKQALDLNNAGLYDEALSAYHAILEDLRKTASLADQSGTPKNIEMEMFCRHQIAHVYFLQKQFQNALPLLSANIDQNIPNGCGEIFGHSVYLSGLIYKELGQYPQAEDAIIRYLNLDSAFTAFRHEAQFELGLIYYQCEKYAESKQQLEKLNLAKSNPRLHGLAQMYLARIGISQGQHRESAAILSGLADCIPSNDVLRFELSYLRGETAFQMRDYSKAVAFFQEALPQKHPEKCKWYADTLYFLGWSYLKLADDPTTPRKDQESYFNQSEESFQKLLKSNPDDRNYLALGQCYLAKAERLEQSDAYTKAEALLQQNVFTTKEARTHALLLHAAAAPSYVQRDKFYRQLAQETDCDDSLIAKGWYMRAMNDFDYAQTLKNSVNTHEAQKALERAAASFQKAFELFQPIDKSKAGASLKFQAIAYSCIGTAQSLFQAFNILEELKNQYADYWHSMEDPDEILYLHGLFAGHLADYHSPEQFISIAEHSFRAADAYQEGKFGDIALLHLGAMHYQNENYADAEKAYIELTNKYPSSVYCGEAWFWAGSCADLLDQEPTIGKQRRRQAFENYPHSPFAPEAYFAYYNYQDYLQGDRNAIKHLQAFPEKFPNSPHLIEVQYLIGLDFKRDRKTPEGKWIRKKNLTQAIDAFQEVETQFDAFAEQKMIPDDRMEYYIAMLYRAILERAMANLAIAQESQGAKRQIYLEYAEEVFKKILADFKSSNHPYTKLLFQQSPVPVVYEESLFGLAQTYIKSINDAQAERTLDEMIDIYRDADISRSYYLSRAWYELGMVEIRKKEYASALHLLKQAEDAAKGNLLGTDQKLDLWIQQSVCYRGLEQFDQALLVLSRVVNDDAISSLRLKAMYLRAEIYELQGRPELARKQLESMGKKGGPWAMKAREKLENNYGY